MQSVSRARLGLAAGILLVATACGGAEPDDSLAVASAADLEGADEEASEREAEAVETDAAGGEELTAEEAALAISVCMRDNGFADFPDPVIEDGTVNLRSALVDSGLDFNDETFRTQIQGCVEDVGAENLGGGGAGRADTRNAVQENLLVYTQCLRDEGLDVGDLDFGNGAGPGGGGGNGQGGNGGGQGGGNGQGGGGGGGGGRIAQALGLDANDPVTADALEACSDVLANAFAGIGGGAGPGAPADPDDA